MKLHIAIPVLNEYKNLRELIKCLKKQSFREFDCVFCVNQNERWWDDPVKVALCEDNQKSIKYLRSVSDIELRVIDRSSKGSGWKEKKGGVGWARKEAMEMINDYAEPDDIIVSMDADTEYPENYLDSIAGSFSENRKALGLSAPYYHRSTNSINDRLIFRYEIYMRYYLLNMLRIGNPYAFTALGSAMAVPVWAYRKVDGLTPVKSGEDFYFLQKLAKSGKLLIWTDSLAYPSSRFSDRVNFGTGPALIKGNKGDWLSYPIYNYDLFDRVKDTFNIFPDLYKNDLVTPMDDFLMEQFNTADLWGALRRNYTDKDNFVKACMKKVDGLRILQFLKSGQRKAALISEENLTSNYIDLSKVVDLRSVKIDFSHTKENFDLFELSKIRELLFEKEMEVRKQIGLTGI